MKTVLGRRITAPEAWFIACQGVKPVAFVEACRKLEFGCVVCRRMHNFDVMAHDSGQPMCTPCFEEAEMENAHSDGHHDETPNERCRECNGGR